MIVIDEKVMIKEAAFCTLHILAKVGEDHKELADACNGVAYDIRRSARGWWPYQWARKGGVCIDCGGDISSVQEVYHWTASGVVRHIRGTTADVSAATAKGESLLASGDNPYDVQRDYTARRIEGCGCAVCQEVDAILAVVNPICD